MYYLRITGLRAQDNNTQNDMKFKFISVQRIGMKMATSLSQQLCNLLVC